MLLEAQALCTNLKLRLQHDYPENWVIEVGPSIDHSQIQVLVANPEANQRHRCDHPVEGFHIERAREAAWLDLPPPR